MFRTMFKKAAARSQTGRELNALSDRELADIGISRGDIRRIARENANRTWL